jgi:hypothetical protein
MIHLTQKWAMMIDINNICHHDCVYCVKHVRHLRDDQKYQISLHDLEKCLDSLEGWPNKIGLTGGDPVTHPQFTEVCHLVRHYIPMHKALIFTSNEGLYNRYKDIINATFGEVYINYHDKEQREVCQHQPMLLSVDDMVTDKTLRDTLIAHCWCNHMWSPIVGKNGAFFCDCALGFDHALDMGGGWTIKKGWWNKSWADYRDQVEKYCGLCGMCLPYPQQTLKDRKEKISAGLYQKYLDHGLKNLDDMEIIREPIEPHTIADNFKIWQPWHNRQDRECGEGPAYVNPC